MPSADSLDSTQGAWFSEQLQAVKQYADAIEGCLNTADWDGLTEILDRRQSFLQQLYTDSALDYQLPLLKQLADAILTTDADFVARIEAEKQLISEQHQSFEHSRRALKAYGKF